MTGYDKIVQNRRLHIFSKIFIRSVIPQRCDALLCSMHGSRPVNISPVNIVLSTSRPVNIASCQHQFLKICRNKKRSISQSLEEDTTQILTFKLTLHIYLFSFLYLLSLPLLLLLLLYFLYFVFILFYINAKENEVPI